MLLVTADTHESATPLLAAIEEEANQLGLQPARPDAFDSDTQDPEHNRRAQLLRMAEGSIPLVFPVVLESAGEDPAVRCLALAVAPSASWVRSRVSPAPAAR